MRRKLPDTVKTELLSECQNRCAVCGRIFEKEVEFEQAHIVQHSDSQDDSPENLLPLCVDCHRRSHSQAWGAVVLKLFKEYPHCRRRKSGKQLRHDVPLVAYWKTGEPTSQSVLKSAYRSVLLVGTSHARVMEGYFPNYADWLNADLRRDIGLLFLNPHSPHAYRRERNLVRRSSREAIIRALKTAYEWNQLNDRFRIGIYDGPYRYSARAIDIAGDSRKSKGRISIFTSCHVGGIDDGFLFRLSSPLYPVPLAYYKKELLWMWQHALANRAGHGLSFVARLKVDERAEAQESQKKMLRECLTRSASKLCGQGGTTYLFEADQLHVTFTSLRRTQLHPWAEPLQLGSQSSEDELPPELLSNHYPMFIRRFFEMVSHPLEFKFDVAFVDDKGQLVQTTSVRNQTAKEIQKFLEWWSSEVNHLPESFRPKYSEFKPHITFGMAFSNRSGLPRPNPTHDQCKLPAPVVFTADCVSIVHYAYRSLLRCVGEATFSKGNLAAKNLDQRLGLNSQGHRCGAECGKML